MIQLGKTELEVDALTKIWAEFDVRAGLKFRKAIQKPTPITLELRTGARQSSLRRLP